LFGLHSMTTAGRSLAMTTPASVADTVKSAVRSAVTTSVAVIRAMCECSA
jgi:hypothetical protein